jgi:uncharacterized protein (TIGR03083 family)
MTPAGVQEHQRGGAPVGANLVDARTRADHVWVRDVPLDYVGHIRHETSLIRAALASVDPSAPVPSCQGWTADDLLRHLGIVLGFWAAVVEERATTPPTAPQPDPTARRPELLNYYDEHVARLTRALHDTAGDTTVWTWSSDRTVDFVRRRVAHECLIHRLDTQLTAQALTPVDADLATDGVDEVVTYFFSGTAQSRFRPTGPIGALRTLDTAGTWVIELGQVTGPSRDGQSYDDRRPGFRLVTHGKPTFMISADASALDAWLWSRPVDPSVTIDGEPHDAAQLTAIITQGIR